MRAIIITFICLCTFNLTAAVLSLTIDGRPNTEIIIKPDASPIVKFSAQELQKTISEISGAKLPVVSTASNADLKIYLGREFAENKFADDIKFLKGTDGFAVRAEGKNIYIFGAVPEGTRNGVYEFLERNTDIIWARPLEFGTIFSKTSTIQLKKINFREKPFYIWRGWQITSVGEKNKKTTYDWLIRNRCNWADYGPRKSIGGGHNIKRILKKQMVDGNPFVGMTKGKRLVKGAPQVCFSNQKMWEVFADNYLKYIEKHPGAKIFEINIDDTNRTCECPQCAKPLALPDGSILKPGNPAFRSTQFYMFLNYVARKVKKIYPEVKISSYAYVFTIIPPKIKLADNISIAFAPLTRDYKGSLLEPVNKKQYNYIQQYCKLCNDIIIREYYGWSEFPRPISDTASKDLLLFNKLGIKKIHSELNADIDKGPWNNKKYMLSQVWDAGAMEYWIISKLYWNPFQNIEKLRDTFINRTFRKAAPAMKRYYDIIRKSWHSTKGKTNFRGYAVSLMAKYVISQGNEQTCRRALREANAKAVDPRVKEMVKRASDLFEKYVEKAKATLPPEATVPYIKNASGFTLDFNSPLWEKSGTVSEFYVMGTNKKCIFNTIVRLMHDNTNLYIGYDCKQSVPEAVKKRSDTTKESWTWGDHLEIFIGDGKRSYYQLNADYKGNKYDAHGFNKSWNGNWTVKTKITADGWKAVAVIPFSMLKIDSSKSSRIKALFYRQYNKAGKKTECSWRGGEVHHPREFGIINIEAKNDK